MADGDITVKQIGHSSRYKIEVLKDGITANLRDVGIGISQVLPVLILAYFAPEGSVIMLEEPEIHLHPLAQSVLAELFAETSKERNIQFIVETHSEHIFRRMQTLIAQQTLVSDVNTEPDVLMYFIERTGSQANLRQLTVDEYGRVKNWPENFFGDSLGESRRQAELMIKRLKEQQ